MRTPVVRELPRAAEPAGADLFLEPPQVADRPAQPFPLARLGDYPNPRSTR